MSISQKCPGCSSVLELETDLVGRKVRCLNCRTPFRVEGSPLDEPPKGSTKSLFIVLSFVGVILLIGGGAIAAFLLQGGGEGSTGTVNKDDTPPRPGSVPSIPKLSKTQIYKQAVKGTVLIGAVNSDGTASMGSGLLIHRDPALILTRGRPQRANRLQKWQRRWARV